MAYDLAVARVKELEYKIDKEVIRMKIIDLLVKIANGEEVPKKIKFKGTIYLWYNRCENTFNYREIYDGRLIDSYLNDNWFIDSKDILNDEIEIIEEDKKIEKIEKPFSLDFINSIIDEESKSGINLIINELINKVDRLIDEVNKLKGSDE